MNKKIVKISNWYLLEKFFVKTLIWFSLFFILYIILATTNFNSTPGFTALIISSFVSLTLLLNDILYWSKSGIYVSDKNDHLVKIGGYFSQESKLLNGVVIASQVKRGPIDQILGMATIQTGLFQDTDKALTGVRYRDIENYDNQMRQGTNEVFNSIF